MATLDRAVALSLGWMTGTPASTLDVARVVGWQLDVHSRVGEVRCPRGGRLRRALDLVPKLRLRGASAAAAEALMAIGQPISSPSRRTSTADSTTSVVPGMIGTPAALIVWRAATLEPMSSIASVGGPIQTRPAASTARAKSAFSARNPYPG
jgi:hypothetical protein